MKRFFCAISLGMLLIQGVGAQMPEITSKVNKIHKASLTLDTHGDLPTFMVSHSDFDISQYHNTDSTGSQIDFPSMNKGGLNAMFFAVYLGQGARTLEGNAFAHQQALHLFDLIHHTAEDHPEMAGLANTPAEAWKLKKKGKIAVFTGIENGWVIGNDLSLIKTYYDLGARYMTLCHTKNNDICDSSTDTLEHHGVSPFGEEVIAEMNRLGMMVDISHTSDSTFYDAIRLSKAPIIASHSSCRALYDHPRNMTDDMIKALAKKGGVIQINFFTNYLMASKPNPARDAAMDSLKTVIGQMKDMDDEQKKNAMAQFRALRKRFPTEPATLQMAVDHIDHVVQLVGDDYVGIGADLDGGGGVLGMNSVEDYENITAELVKRGYTKKQIKKIWSGNFFRVMKEVEKVAKKLNS